MARYYHSDTEKNARVSTEITGYSISFLVYLYRRTGQKSYLDSALRAGHFLVHHAWDCGFGLFPFEHSFNGAKPHALAYFFDSGIIVRGLLAIWRVTQEQAFVDAAIAAGRRMIPAFLGSESTHPILALPGGNPLPYEPRWSASPGCYQLKSAMAWQDLFEETGDAEFESAYDVSVKRALANDDCFLPGEANPERVMDRLHAYLYYLEGLLPCAERPECAEAIRSGIDKVERHLTEIAPVFARSDVYAQLLRMRIFAADSGVAAMRDTAAASEAMQAASFQFHGGGARFEGGYGFGVKAGKIMPFVNPVSTAFCAQALDMWHGYLANRSVPDRKALV